jgi:hypothetical protein
MPAAIIGAATGNTNKAFAVRALARVDREATFCADQVASMAKWLMASLLAINAGGGIAAINTPSVSTLVPSAFFGAGAIFALLSGAAMQEVTTI